MSPEPVAALSWTSSSTTPRPSQSTDFGDSGLFALDAANTAAIGAEKSWISLSEVGNDPGTTFAELRGLKGKMWFVLSISSGDQAQAQLLALGKLVIARTAALQ